MLLLSPQPTSLNWKGNFSIVSHTLTNGRNTMSTMAATYPSSEERSRAVLVRNISHIATSAAIEEFFSFCGPVVDHRLRTVPPTKTGGDPTLEAVVIFADDRVCEDALVMNESSIVDQPVSITRVPDDYDFNKPLPDGITTSAPQRQGLFGGFSAFGDLFAGVGSAVASEVGKAGKMFDSATETGVLKQAKDNVALATQRTRDFAVDLDDKWHVRNNILNAAEVGKAKASEVASAVANQTTAIATEVDSRLQISENTGKLAEKAREVPAVNQGVAAITGGFHTLMAQTGLAQQQQNGTNALPPDGTPPGARTAQGTAATQPE